MESAAVAGRLGRSRIGVKADVYSQAIRGRDDEAAKGWDEFQKKNPPEIATAVQ